MTRNRSSVYHGGFECATIHGSTRSAESTLQVRKHLWPGVAGQAPEMMRCVLDALRARRHVYGTRRYREVEEYTAKVNHVGVSGFIAIWEQRHMVKTYNILRHKSGCEET